MRRASEAGMEGSVGPWFPPQLGNKGRGEAMGFRDLDFSSGSVTYKLCSLEQVIVLLKMWCFPLAISVIILCRTVSMTVRSHDVCKALCAWSVGCTPYKLTFLLCSSFRFSFQIPNATNKNDQALQNDSFKVFCAKVHLGSKIFPFRCIFLCSCRLMCICASLWLHTAVTQRASRHQQILLQQLDGAGLPQRLISEDASQTMEELPLLANVILRNWLFYLQRDPSQRFPSRS